jgi:recombination protein RecA
MKIKKDKPKTIDEVLSNAEKAFGKNIIHRFGDGTLVDAEVVPTGSWALDKALGVGGVPRGRVIEVFGQPSSGKSTVSLSIIAEAQKQKLDSAFIDAECALSISLAKGVGVNIDKLYISQPDYGEQALDLAIMLVESGKFAFIVIDSVAALIPKAELDGSMTDQQMGLQARMMGKALRKLTTITASTNTSVVFINQVRDKIGGFGFGPKSDTPGGKALKFFSSVRLDVKRTGSLKHGEKIIGNKLKIIVVKNKLAPPFGEANTELIFGKGFNKEGEVLDLAIEKDIIEKTGSWFSYNEEKIGQGRPGVCEYLRENNEVLEEIKEKLGMGDTDESTEEV